jgi:hypothetical protein
MKESKGVRRILRRVFPFGAGRSEQPHDLDPVSSPGGEDGDPSWEDSFLQEVFPENEASEETDEDNSALLSGSEIAPPGATHPGDTARIEAIDVLEKELADLKKSTLEKNLQILKQEQIIQKSLERLEGYQRRIRSLERPSFPTPQAGPVSAIRSDLPDAERGLVNGPDPGAPVKRPAGRQDSSPAPASSATPPGEETALRVENQKLTAQNLLLQETLEEKQRIVSMLQKENRGLRIEQKAFLQELDARGGTTPPQTLAVLASSFDTLMAGYERTKGALEALEQATAGLRDSTALAERNLAAEKIRTTALERGLRAREAALLQRLEEKVQAAVSMERALKTETDRSTGLENKLEQDRKEIARLLSREAELTEKQRAHKKEIAELAKMVEASNQIMSRFEEEVKQKQDDVAALESKVRELVRDHEKEIYESQERLRMCQDELSAADKRNRESQEVRKALELALQDQKAGASRLEEDFKQLYERARIRELETERESGKREEQIQDLVRRDRSREEEFDRLRGRLEEKDREVHRLQNAFLDAEARLIGREKTLKEELEWKDGEIRHLNDLVLQKKEKIEQLKFSLQHGFGTKNSFLTRFLPPLVWLVSLALLSLYGFS